MSLSRTAAKVSSACVLYLCLALLTVRASNLPFAGHKLRVSDPAAAAAIAAQGGQLLADYGNFQLFGIARISPGLFAKQKVELHDDYNLVLLNAGHVDTSWPAVQALREPLARFKGKRLHLVQFIGPVQPQWLAQLQATGAQVIDYLPHHAYLVYGDADTLGRVQSLAATAPHIQWEAPYADDYKTHPRARLTDRKGNLRNIGTDMFAVQLVADSAANLETLALLDRLKREAFRRHEQILNYVNVIVRLDPQDLALIARQPDLISIQPYFGPRKFCERQDQIVAGNLSGNVPAGPGYLAWLASKGFTQAQFTASGFVVDMSDSGLDNGTTSPNHLGLHTAGVLTNASRVVYARLEGSPNAGSTLAGCDGHGTLNSHIVGGYNDLTGFPHTDSAGFHYGLGACPFVALGSSVIFDPEAFTNPNYNDLQSEAYESGARISNNSWGDPVHGAYDVDAQTYDILVRDAQRPGSTFAAGGNQEMVIVFAAGNSGSSAVTIGSPGSAKNVITVGASENVQPFGGNDGSGISDAMANSADDIVYFSSRGPCADGRHKPDLVAPGTHVSGGVAQAPTPGPTGTADACFTGGGVSGGVGSPFYPAGQQFYTASSGTSHSTPCVSGGCALIRQFFINNFSNPPSPAMTKAYLLNSARYLTGTSANDTLWSDTQGMGEMNLGMAFDGTPRLLRDENPADLFTVTGQTRTYTGTITDTNKPLRVTLAWTDARGSTAGAAYNNDLDLTVTVGGITYRGNVFSGAYSIAGGTADPVNNVESVFLPPGSSGTFAINVTAANITSDSLSNSLYGLNQDFALVAYNANADRVPVILGSGWTLAAEGCTPNNGVIDPGETVTLLFALQNFGTGDTTNLVATLLPQSGVGSPGAPQAFGRLVAGGASVVRPFSFTANAACGSTIVATLQLQDGAADLGTISFNLVLGQTTAATDFGENFDLVLPPALPPGWFPGVSGAGSDSITEVGISDTVSNAVFIGEPDAPGVGELISPSISITSASAQLSFQNKFDLEADPSGTIGYDGGVLEIQIGNGTFTDILVAGGSFVSGGYTLPIDSTSDNPLAGRQAWSGGNGGFTHTVVQLPAAAAGQTVQFKWRLGTDSGNFYGGTGWYIDTVLVQDLSYTCCGTSNMAPSILGQPTNQTVLSGGRATFQVSVAGSAPLSYQWLFNGSKLGGATTDPLTLTNLQASQMGSYAVLITNISGSVTSAPANLKVLVSPLVTNVTVTRGTVTVSLSSVAGLHYLLEYKNALTDAQWLALSASGSGNGGALSLSDTNPPALRRFYRVRCQ